MKDTSEQISILFRNMIMKRDPAERLMMGCSMFDSAKTIVKSAILNQNSKITPKVLKKEIFLRFYGTDLDEIEKKKVISALWGHSL